MRRLKNRIIRWVNNKADFALDLLFTTIIAGTTALTVFFALMGAAHLWSK